MIDNVIVTKVQYMAECSSTKETVYPTCGLNKILSLCVLKGLTRGRICHLGLRRHKIRQEPLHLFKPTTNQGRNLLTGGGGGVEMTHK